jgi:hypothetical protein
MTNQEPTTPQSLAIGEVRVFPVMTGAIQVRLRDAIISDNSDKFAEIYVYDLRSGETLWTCLAGPSNLSRVDTGRIPGDEPELGLPRLVIIHGLSAASLTEFRGNPVVAELKRSLHRAIAGANYSVVLFRDEHASA